MRICIIVLVLVLVGCESPKKKYDFTFYKWNIHESYYLKFNSSDTLYYVDAYGFKKEETFFAILNKEEKERIQNILDTITFPKEESFENSTVDDGETNAFVLKSEQKSKKLKIHESGPEQFWLFGKVLERIKLGHEFAKTNKKVDLKEINDMVLMKVPSSFVVETKFNNHYDIYPPDCYLIFQNKKRLIKEIYKYKRGILNEYWFLGSEGFAVEKLGMNGNKYSKEQECRKFLNLEKAKDYLAFNSVRYKIDYIKGDTIISKIDTNDIVIFIDEK